MFFKIKNLAVLAAFSLSAGTAIADSSALVINIKNFTPQYMLQTAPWQESTTGGLAPCTFYPFTPVVFSGGTPMPVTQVEQDCNVGEEENPDSSKTVTMTGNYSVTWSGGSTVCTFVATATPYESGYGIDWDSTGASASCANPAVRVYTWTNGNNRVFFSVFPPNSATKTS